ncbi:hypothetical protein HU200_052530 [Digitaria exilis]|uniref:GCK domain-containing protein n=1 Tax=Digitaria exilis TaxID=1010633 RepID=A0A835AYR4_9POAL|nr:hypothetical protein HU200_052530 [Digitaria exilis]
MRTRCSLPEESLLDFDYTGGIKINVEGSFVAETGDASIGMIARNFKGEIVFTAWRGGLRALYIETDCARVVKALEDKGDKSELSFIFTEAREHGQLLRRPTMHAGAERRIFCHRLKEQDTIFTLLFFFNAGECLEEFADARFKCLKAAEQDVDWEACVKATSAFRACMAANPSFFKGYIRALDEGIEEDEKRGYSDEWPLDGTRWRWWSLLRDPPTEFVEKPPVLVQGRRGPWCLAEALPSGGGEEHPGRDERRPTCAWGTPGRRTSRR